MIESAQSILIVSHIRPDGDAIGSMLALKTAIELASKRDDRKCAVQIMLLSDPGDTFDFMLSKQYWLLNDQITTEQIQTGRLDQFDLVIVVDTSAAQQLPDLADYLIQRISQAQQTRREVLVIDHHLSGDLTGSSSLIDTHAAAAGQIVYELCAHADWPIDLQVAQALFVAIVTDTGWFKYENTSDRIFEIIAHLTKIGVRPNILYQKLYQNFPPQRMRLLASALATMELHCQNRVAIIHITSQMLEHCQAGRHLVEDIVNEPMQIGSILAVALLVELQDGTTRGSLRSRGSIDVSLIAKQFGGGGHARAAGLIIKENMQSAREKILNAMKDIIPPQ